MNSTLILTTSKTLNFLIALAVAISASALMPSVSNAQSDSAWIHRVVTLDCRAVDSSLQRKLKVVWDTRKAKMGPAELTLDGLDLIRTGRPLVMRIDPSRQVTAFTKEDNSFYFEVPWSVEESKSSGTHHLDLYLQGQQTSMVCRSSKRWSLF